MDCQSCREQIPQLLDGTLPPPLVAELGSHLAACDACRIELGEEQALTRRLREVTRYRAPDLLRTRIERGLRTEKWGGPVSRVSGKWVAVAAVFFLAVAASFLFLRERKDTLEALVAEATAHHQRMVWEREMRGFARAEVPSPEEFLPLVRERLNLPVESIFVGDPSLTLVGIRAIYVLDHTAIALVYADPGGSISTLLMLRGGKVKIPQGNRMQVETFRPYHTRTNTANVLIWKQKEMAYSLVAQVEDQDMADLFLKVRKAM